MPLVYDPTGRPVEIAPGRGDLRYSSAPFSPLVGSTSVRLVGDRTVSYADIFATQPVIAMAVMRMLLWAIRVPLKVYRRTGDNERYRLSPDEHPLAQAVVAPWEGGAQAQLIMALLGPLLVHGNGLTELDQGASNALRFDALDWRYAKPIKAIQRTISGWQVTEDGAAREVGADTVMHLAWWSPLGPIGVSPLQQLGTSLSIEDAAQRYQKGLFRNGARPPSAITATAEFLGLDRDVRDALMGQLRGDVTALYANPDNAGRPAILPPGLDWKQVGHTAVEAELIQQRHVVKEEVCGVYMIPPPMLGAMDKTAYNNMTTMREMAYTDGLGPPLVLIEQMINAHVIRGLLRENDLFVEFDFAGVLRGDRLKEIQALQLAIGSGLMTPNEGRDVLNYPRSTAEGADVLYMPSNNMQPLPVTVTDTPPDGGAVDSEVDGGEAVMA